VKEHQTTAPINTATRYFDSNFVWYRLHSPGFVSCALHSCYVLQNHNFLLSVMMSKLCNFLLRSLLNGITMYNIHMFNHLLLSVQLKNVIHCLFNLLRIKDLYMFWAMLVHPQEVLHKWHLVYCVCVMSVGCTRIGVLLYWYAMMHSQHNIKFCYYFGHTCHKDFLKDFIIQSGNS
jgi:hypothetical protein